MAGEDFTVVPNTVITIEPIYNNVVTKTESQKKEYFAITSTAIEVYQLEFKAKTSTERDTILTHFKAQTGGYYPFAWTSVPDYIGSGANITGRWVQGSFQMTENSNHWKITINFEKDN